VLCKARNRYGQRKGTWYNKERLNSFSSQVRKEKKIENRGIKSKKLPVYNDSPGEGIERMEEFWRKG